MRLSCTTKLISCLMFLAVLMAACQAKPAEPAQTAVSPAATAAPAITLPADKGKLFAGSGACAVCHTSMVDKGGQDVSNDSLWRSTMLANAARDPYWLATVRSEVDQHPALQETIEKKCATCHMPMAETTALAEGEKAEILDAGFLSVEHPLHPLAMDGVSCTLCHQVEPDNFGRAESFSGGYLVDTTRPVGERLAYGPYVIGEAQATVMKSVSGYQPLLGEHLAQSEMCGACHDLLTPYVDREGQVAGEFGEQMIYSEWLNSAYKERKSCQDCHMPLGQGGVQLSTTGGPKRSPFYQHIFVGGNAFMGRILQANGEALGVTASAEHFEATIARVVQQMSIQTVVMLVNKVRLEGQTLLGEVAIQNQVGHKFPAGFPSRRVWLHIVVKDAAGQVVFESGAVGPDGRITGNDNDDDPTRYEPHYAVLSTPDQVQIYEGIMFDSDGQVTTTLLRGAVYGKDNRLLPVGFDVKKASKDTAVMGEAAQDKNFSAGGDLLQLELDLGQAQGPLTLLVELFYQSIGYRWSQNLMLQQNGEAQLWAQYYASVPNLPLLAASVEVQVK
ncbi:MAG: hypothetical protein JXB15_15800 [Anaerolineales bacterium]|nr:hypothetical protein [Anaerolineales bacterium]